jgi:hypothetical protein
MKSWADRDHPSYHGTPSCFCRGCGYVTPMSEWGMWCYECNVARMDVEPACRFCGEKPALHELSTGGRMCTDCMQSS